MSGHYNTTTSYADPSAQGSRYAPNDGYNGMVQQPNQPPSDQQEGNSPSSMEAHPGSSASGYYAEPREDFDPSQRVHEYMKDPERYLPNTLQDSDDQKTANSNRKKRVKTVIDNPHLGSGSKTNHKPKKDHHGQNKKPSN